MLKRTIGAFTKSNTAALVAPWQSGQAQLPNLNYETLFREGYGKNPVVFACVDEWATDFAEPELRAYRNTPNGPEIVSDHPAITLWNEPNRWLSGDDLAAAVQMYKRLAGNTYLLKVRSGANKVVELWIMRPDRVSVIPDRDKFIRGYQFRNGPDVIDIPAEDVIHLKTRHPFNDWYGMPPLMAAAGRVDIDNFMQDIIKGFLRNSGVPAGIMRIQGNVSEQEKALFRSRFRLDFGGDSSGNVMVINGPKDAVDYQPLAMPLGARGLVIPELDEMSEARIAMVFHVPQSILNSRLGMSSSSYGNRKSDREEFTQRQLVPEWQSVASALTQSLLPDFGGADFLAFDLSTVQALSQDMTVLSDRIMKEFLGGARSREEARKALGLPPDADPAEMFYIPTTVVPTPAGTETDTMPELPAGPDQGTLPIRQLEVIDMPVRKTVVYDQRGRRVATVETALDD